MDIGNRILDLLIQSTNLTPLTFLILLVLIGSFLWLAKELKAQQDSEEETKKVLTENAIKSFVDILYEINIYNDSQEIAPIFRAIYSSIPYIDHKISKKFIEIIESNIKNEDKLETIKSIAISETAFLSETTGNHLLKKKLLTDDVENLFIKLRKIFSSMFMSAFIIYMVLILFSISFLGETQFWMIIKPIAFFLIFLFFPFTLDLLIQKRINLKTTCLIIGIIISATLVALGTGKILMPSLIALVILIALFIFYALRVSKTDINKPLKKERIN